MSSLENKKRFLIPPSEMVEAKVNFARAKGEKRPSAIEAQ